MDEDDLFNALDDKVASGVDRALVHAHDLVVRLVVQHAVRRAQHDGHPADRNVLARDDVLAAHVLHIHKLEVG